MLEFLDSTPSIVKGKQVLELGTGTGIGGIAAAVCGAKQVIVTDLPEALERCRANIIRNKDALLGRAIKALPLDWGSESFPDLFSQHTDVKNKPGGKTLTYPDLILIADCVYNRTLWKLLRRVMLAYTGPNTKILQIEGMRGTVGSDWFKEIALEYKTAPAILAYHATNPTESDRLSKLLSKHRTLAYTLRPRPSKNEEKKRAACGRCGKIATPSWTCLSKACSMRMACGDCEKQLHEPPQDFSSYHLRLCQALQSHPGVNIVRGLLDAEGCKGLLRNLMSPDQEWNKNIDSVDGSPQHQHDMYSCENAMNLLASLDKQIQPLIRRLYGYSKQLRMNGHFVRRYCTGERRDFRPHYDSSTFTVNIALSSPYDYKGSALIIYNGRESKKIANIVKEAMEKGKHKSAETEESLDKKEECQCGDNLSQFGLKIVRRGSKEDASQHSPLEFVSPTPSALDMRSVKVELGDAVVHSGNLYHGVTRLETGIRFTLIMFYT